MELQPDSTCGGVIIIEEYVFNKILQNLTFIMCEDTNGVVC